MVERIGSSREVDKRVGKETRRDSPFRNLLTLRQNCSFSYGFEALLRAVNPSLYVSRDCKEQAF